MTEERDGRQVVLSPELVDVCAERARRTEFRDATEYIEHVLEEVLYNVSEANASATGDQMPGRETVENRLESLGYLQE